MKLKIREDEDHTFKVNGHTYHWDGNAILHWHSNAGGIGWRKIGKAGKSRGRRMACVETRREDAA